jgi:citrate synthase
MGIVEVLCLCAFNLASFVIGAKIGQKIIRQETIEVNPVKAVNKAVEVHKENKIKEAEDEYYKAIYQNIDNYSGDSLGQIDIPKRK